MSLVLEAPTVKHSPSFIAELRDLPNEILAEILKRLNRQATHTFAGTSKSMNAVATPLLYADLRGCHAVDDKGTQYIVALCRLDSTTYRGVQDIIKHCKQLRHLEVACLNVVTDASFQLLAENYSLLQSPENSENYFKQHTLERLVRNAKHLRRLDISHAHLLETTSYLDAAPAHLATVTDSPPVRRIILHPLDFFLDVFMPNIEHVC
ncbi:hypothetical protein HKX48_008466 [Thoreauomyces humboldtii]|nr:hypothetical protein HKX48_008466 [Thoreauomyces humboldtii]